MGDLLNSLDPDANSACPAVPTTLFPQGRLPFIAKNEKKQPSATKSKIETMMAELEALKKHGEKRVQQMATEAKQRADALEESVTQAATQMTNVFQQLTDMQASINNNNELANQRMAAMESMNLEQQKNNAKQFSKIMEALQGLKAESKDDSDDDNVSKDSKWRGNHFRNNRNQKRASSASPSRRRSRSAGGSKKSKDS
jgi:hypothetical protein